MYLFIWGFGDNNFLQKNMRKFYNITASVYRIGTIEKKWSLVETRTVLYENIKIAFWYSAKNYSNTNLATQTDQNKFEVNLMPNNPVIVWDIFLINWENYKVDDVIPHHRSNWILDNYQVYISKTEKNG